MKMAVKKAGMASDSSPHSISAKELIIMQPTMTRTGAVAAGFITYCLTMVCKRKGKEVHPIIWTVSALFILDFVLQAVL